MNIKEFSQLSRQIRDKYHQLEVQHHGSQWSTEEDALAFLTDAALVGRYIMSKEERWPHPADQDLAYKIGESVWWLAILAQASDLDFEACLQTFLDQRIQALKLDISHNEASEA
ncbi:TPA: MazG-like protein [Streptococcus suis]